MDYIQVKNFTSFMKREMFIYSLGSDMRLKKPVSIRLIGYIFLSIICWPVPLTLIFGFPKNVFAGAIYLLPVVVFPLIANKNIWFGRTFFQFAKIARTYIGEARAWAGVTPIPKEPEKLEPGFRVWVSRRRELYELSQKERGD